MLRVVPHLGQADLHLHTLASDGLMSPRALLDYAEHTAHLDVIAVTDHDETASAEEARLLAADLGYRVQVIPGVEVTTRDGHLLALFVSERPPALRSAVDSAAWVRDHGGVCIAPHPFTRITHSLGRKTMHQLADRGLLAGAEVLNASPAGRRSHLRCRSFAELQGLAEVGGSDAHMLRCVGLARTSFPGRSPAELRAALLERTTRAEGRFATLAEIAAEAAPQLARSLVHLPLRRVRRTLAQRISRPGPSSAGWQGR